MKIIIVSKTTNFEIPKILNNINDDLNICYKFSNDKKYVGYTIPNLEYVYYLTTADIELASKNNSIIYIKTSSDDNYISCGVSKDDFENSNILSLTIDEFNKIPTSTFENIDNLLVVWIDYSQKNNDIPTYEYNYFMERLDTLTYIYLLNETPRTVANVILEYINGDEDKKSSILFEYC